MLTKLLLEYVSFLDLALCVGLIILLWRKDKVEDFRFFLAYLLTRITELCFSIPILFFRKEFHIPRTVAWKAYWGGNWCLYLVEAAFQALTIYAIYQLAMKPLPGLQKIGQIIFRWVAGISFGLSVFFAIGPRVGTPDYWSLLTSQVHQGIGVLSLCLLLFVCLAIRPLGLTFRSHLFGLSLGLGMDSVFDLISAAWFPTAGARSLYSPLYLWLGIGAGLALILWITYFALPEPERKMILLPTTSPFFHWNSISEALGDEPGYVAVAGFTPDMLSAAEIEELSRPPQSRAALESDSDQHQDDDESDGPRSDSSFSIRSIDIL